MIERILFIIPVAIMALASPFVSAGEPENITVALVATVPTDTFYVRADKEPNLSMQQIMKWGPEPYLQPLDFGLMMKNSLGGIKVKLDNPAELYGPKGNKIVLDVTVNDTPVTLLSTVVLAAAEAKTDSSRRLVIKQKDTTAKPVPGRYKGTVSLIFEPEA